MGGVENGNEGKKRGTLRIGSQQVEIPGGNNNVM